MPRVIHYGSHDGTKLHASSFAAAVRSWPPGTALKFTVDKYVGEKTIPQLGYLHTLFTIAARELNREGFGDGQQWTAETVKQFCKDQKLYPVVDRMMPGGVIVQVTLDTRHLNVEQMGQTIDRVIRYFADWSIILPEPRQQQRMVI